MTPSLQPTSIDDHARERAQHGDVAPIGDQSGAGAGGGRVRVVVLAGVSVVIAAMIGLYLRAAARTNHVALSQAAKPVAVVKATASTFRPVHTYIGTTGAWDGARVGPQYVAAYVSTVLVRPGAVVKRGEVLATLDCRNSSAESKAIAAKAKAIEERQLAAEHMAQRTKEMEEGGFASKNELEQLSAHSASEEAEAESLRASLVSRSLAVDDCIMRAPFTGEVSDRFVDPGAYIRPGNPIVALVDRNRVRVMADAPESDFTVVVPGTMVHIVIEATGAKLDATISRRAPAADESTRTVHFEIDLDNTNHSLPVGSTARLSIEVGKPVAATMVPLSSAMIRGEKATVYVVDGDIARRRDFPVLGEAGGSLYLEPQLKAGQPVVVEGRALLDDGDKVTAKESAL